MIKLFEISIGVENGVYSSRILSLTDKQVCELQSPKLRLLTAEMRQLVRGKEKEMRNFPMDAPSRIINPADLRPPLIAINGRH